MRNYLRESIKHTYGEQLLSYFEILKVRALSGSLPATFDAEMDEFLSELRAEISQGDAWLTC